MFSNEPTLMNFDDFQIGIDTNILVYSLNSESIYHEKAKEFINNLSKKRILGVITWQNLSELYAVATDKKRFPGFMAASQAVTVIKNLLGNKNIKLILPTTSTGKTFFDLIMKNKPKGQKIHDIFLSATLLSNGIHTLVTENTKDFSGITNLKAETLNSF
mgnify:CR=1 FL=1